MSNILISRSTVTGSMINLTGGVILSAMAVLGYILNSHFMIFICVLGVIQTLGTSAMREVRLKGDYVYVASLYKSDVRILAKDIVSIKGGIFLLGGLRIHTKDGIFYDFIPLLELDFFNFNSTQKFIEKWFPNVADY